MEKISNLYKYLFFGCLAALFIFSAIPNFEVESHTSSLKVNFGLRSDYFAHLVAYMALVVFFLLWKNTSRNMVLFAGLAVVIGLSVASLTEYQQLYIPGRTFNPVDIFYGGVGVLVGVIGFFVVQAWIKVK